MKKSEFNKLVNQTKKDLLKQDAKKVFDTLNSLHLYRLGGIEFNTLDKIYFYIAGVN